MSDEVEIPLEPDAFEAVRRGRPITPRPVEDWSIKSLVVVEQSANRRTGRWMAFEVLNTMVYRPPMAACYARNPAAARVDLNQDK